MGSRAETSTTRQIRERARQLGVDIDVTQSQLDAWRRRRLIPTPATVGRGQRQGVGRVYDERQLDYIIEFAQQPRDHLDVIPAAMFVRGHDVPEDCLRTSYRLLLEDLRVGLEALAAGGDVLDAAELFAQKAHRIRGPEAMRARKYRRSIYEERRSDPFFPEDQDDPKDFAGFNRWVLMNTFLAGSAPDQLTDDGLRDLTAIANPIIAAATGGAQLRSDEDRQQLHANITHAVETLYDLVETAPYSQLKWAAELLYSQSADPFHEPDAALGPLLAIPLTEALKSVQDGQLGLGPQTSGSLSLEGENPS